MAATLIVDIVTNATKAVAGFSKVDDAATKTATKTKSAGSKIAGLATAVTGAFAVTKILDFGKESVAAAQNAAVANARLAKIFANVGDKSGEAAKGAEEFAEKLGTQIGVAPTVIEGAQGVLAAFAKVSDESARQAGIFDGATKAAADLAAAGFGDITSNAKLLGKALTDPTKGMTALRRSGVVLTAAQQKQIESMQKQGDLLGAQKLLLGDVNKAVGGTAAATATAGSKMAVSWEIVQEKIGTKLLPVFDRFKGILIGLVSFVSANAGWLLPITVALGILIGLVKTITAVTKIWTAVTGALDLVLDANPVVLIVLAVVGLIAAIVLLTTKSQAFRDFWKAVWAGVLNIISAVWGWIKKNWPYLLGILLGPVALAAAAIYKNFGSIKAAAYAVWRWIAQTWATLYGYIVGPVETAAAALARVWASIAGAAARAWAAVVAGARGALNFVTGIPGDIARAFASLFSIITTPFIQAWTWINAHVLNPLKTGFSTAFAGINRAIGDIKSVWNHLADTLNNIHISIHMPSNVVTKFLHIAGAGFTWSWPSFARLPHLARGGVFDRPTAAIVGEAGREIVTPEKLLRKIVGSGSVNITVNVPPTANPAEVGRQTVKALRAYVRANGPIPGIAAPT